MYRANLIGYGLVRSMPGSSRPALVTSVRGALEAPAQEKMSVRVARRMDAWLSGAADAIVFNSHRGAAQHAAIGYCMKRATVIPNFFDVERFRTTPEERRAMRLSLGVGASLLIALVGRFDGLKDHRSFLQAARAVRMRFPQSQLLLVGRGCDEGNGKLMRWIDEYGLKGAIRLLGERRDVPAILSAVDLAVSSSLSEGFPNVVGEAMACGTPCVVTDVGDSRFLVGDAGLVVPPCDPAALANAIIELGDLPEDARRRLGEKARQRITTEFAMMPVVNSFAEVYQRCIRDRVPQSPALARSGEKNGV
jgi:glycosyltransferase involved in cell wall biosynthesis